MKIKFSHSYPKLWGQTQGKLIYVVRIDGKNLDKDLIEYDTKYSVKHSVPVKVPLKHKDGTYVEEIKYVDVYDEDKYYPLPKTELIQLVFLGNKGIPFCTLRRFTEQKFKYYSNKINEIFDIVVEG